MSNKIQKPAELLLCQLELHIAAPFLDFVVPIISYFPEKSTENAVSGGRKNQSCNSGGLVYHIAVIHYLI